MILLGALLLAPADMRAADILITSDQTVNDLASCSIRALNSVGRAATVPLDGGVAVDFNMKNLIGADGKNLATFEFKDDGAHRTIEVFYRHPWSAKATAGFTRSLAKRCFKVEYDEWVMSRPDK